MKGRAYVSEIIYISCYSSEKYNLMEHFIFHSTLFCRRWWSMKNCINLYCTMHNGIQAMKCIFKEMADGDGTLRFIQLDAIL